MAGTSSNLVAAGDYVILRKDKVFKVIQVRRDRKIYVEKKKFTLNGIIGHPYGTAFELDNGQLKKASVKNYDADIDIDEDAGKDNRNIKDDSDNQKMSRDDLVGLKKSGATGEDIVEQLVENSATFKGKTNFSQQKYLKKKKKKYVPLFTILKPCARLLCQMYMNKGPNKICCLRVDSLGQILTHANVRPGNNMMVVESCLGLLTGAVMERMAGQGTIMQFYNGCAPTRTVLEAYDFPASYYDQLHCFPLELISTIKQDAPLVIAKSGAESTGKDESSTGDIRGEESQGDEENEQMADCDMGQGNGGAEVIDESTKTADGEDKPNFRWSGDRQKLFGRKRRPPPTEEEKQQRRESRQKQLQESRDIIKPARMDGLIVATKLYPSSIVLALREFVLPSRPIIVFSQYKEPLLDCYQKLRDHGSVIMLKLTETWLREYQVLPDRTHPKMQMSGTGGYILTGVTVGK